MEKTLMLPSKPRYADTRLTVESLIEEWIPKLAINAGAALDAKTQAVYRSIWLEGLGDLSPRVLLAAFQKTLRECAYWPVKVADIRKHVSTAETNAVNVAAERAWERVLELRRLYWNPDMPGGFSRGMPQLSERVKQACRAAGVFREVESVNDLHVWARERFIESYLAWAELEQDQFLLPDGELKNLLAGVAETKVLPPSQVSFDDLHARGLRYAEQVKAAAPLIAISEKARPARLWASKEEREEAYAAIKEKETDPRVIEEIRRQKAALLAKDARPVEVLAP